MYDIYSAPDQAVFKLRRERMFSLMQENSIAVIANAPIAQRNADCNYTYRPDSSFYYLTGFAEPGSAALFVKRPSGVEYILFCRDKNPIRDLWDGAAVDAESARGLYLSDAAYPAAKFSTIFSDLINSAGSLYYSKSCAGVLRLDLASILSKHKKPTSLDILPLLMQLRSKKDSREIAMMQKAADISVLAHEAGMRFTRPGMFEWQVAAEITHAMQSCGAMFHAYDPIVAAGSNACVLHYTSLQSKICDNDLLLVDAGCEYGLYASDITRTYPAGGKFTGAARDLYAAVLDVQYAAIAELSRGAATLKDLQDFTVRQITEKLCDLNILSGSVDSLVQQGAYKPFYPHGVGHAIGLDVHDINVSGAQSYLLESGVAITVEPGIYVSAQAGVDEKWHGLGVRIEDDVHINAGGVDVMTQDLAKDIADIEAIMRDAKCNQK
jgi:Xaa-Pro aminopeptidase